MSHTELLSDPFENTSVAKFYEGKTVFLTGGTGFIGKVIVEKLLRSCPDLKNIYFLIRPKKGLTCDERMKKMFEVPVCFINCKLFTSILLCSNFILHVFSELVLLSNFMIDPI